MLINSALYEQTAASGCSLLADHLPDIYNLIFLDK